MIEARIGQIIFLKTPSETLEGVIDSVELDRITINYFKRDSEKFKALQEGETLKVFVHTKSGVKKMKSLVIDSSGEKLVIENAPTIFEVNNRQDVRTTVGIKIFIRFNTLLIPAVTLDISAGGVRFEVKDKQNLISLDNDAEIDVKFMNNIFKQEISLRAKIIKKLSNEVFVAQFIDDNENLRNKISSFCMNNMD